MIIRYTELPAAARYIRTAVFMEEQGYQNEFDDIDAYAIHFVAFHNSIPVGTCRLYQTSTSSTWRLGRLAVIAVARGKHIGQELLQYAAVYAQSQGATCITLSAQIHALSFYKQAGYRATGVKTMDEGHPHITMHLSLPSVYEKKEF